MTDLTVTITKAEYDHYRAVERAAQRAIMSATVRDTGQEWHDAWLHDLNELAILVPSTRIFERDPLT